MVTIQFQGTTDEVRKEMSNFLGHVAPAAMQTEPQPDSIWPTPEEVAEKTAQAEADKPKRHRRTKAEMDAARAAEAEAERASVTASPTEAAAPQPEPRTDEFEDAKQAAEDPAEPLPPATFLDVENALKAILETDGLGVTAGRKFLQEGFGVARLSLIDEARWPEFVAKAKALVAGAGK